ncbi:MAG: winged helix-turn-helix transcriptional regulator [Sphingomonadaceae bacterium]|nr:winged helix-turn-helix transcriptional regulator [Sphingomonadaceae bacterium]
MSGEDDDGRDELAGLRRFIGDSKDIVGPDEAPAIVALSRMVRLVSRMRRHQVEVSERVGLQVGDLDILYLLQRSTAENRPRITDLAAILAVTPGGISKRVDRLESGGLIERLWSQDDRRACRIAPTEQGLDRARRARTLSRSVVLGALSPGEWERLDRMLSRIGKQSERDANS